MWKSLCERLGQIIRSRWNILNFIKKVLLDLDFLGSISLNDLIIWIYMNDIKHGNWWVKLWWNRILKILKQTSILQILWFRQNLWKKSFLPNNLIFLDVFLRNVANRNAPCSKHVGWSKIWRWTLSHVLPFL